MHIAKWAGYSIAGVLVFGLVSSASAVSLLPLDTLANESGLGDVDYSLSDTFAAAGYSGTIDSRVYTQGSPITQVTFVWDVQITGGFSDIEDMTISAATASDPDLDFSEIVGHLGLGYMTDLTVADCVPDEVDAVNNIEIDTLTYKWNTPGRPGNGERVILYLTTTGLVDIDTVIANLNDFGGTTADVLAPVDNPSDPDIGVPEPMTLSLMLAGGLFLCRRRR